MNKKYNEEMTDEQLDELVIKFMEKCDLECSCMCKYADPEMEYNDDCVPRLLFECYRHWKNLKENG